MIMTKRQDKILGGLLGAAIGDAIGASTETRTIDLIRGRFGGFVTDFVEKPSDNLSRGTVPGYVTDDFSIAYYTACEIIASQSRITEDIAKKALIKWWDDGGYVQFIGPTTRASIMNMKGSNSVDKSNSYKLEVPRVPIACDNEKATNGAGMKTGLIGLFNPGDIDRAIDEAIVMSLPTHNNTIAIAGGTAIAAAAAKAMQPNTSYMEVIQAGIYGAAEGYKRVKGTVNEVCGGNIERRINFAVEIGLRYQNDFEKTVYEVADTVGCGLYAYEAIPAVFAFIAACEGRSMDSICMGINCGDDTDTIACMIGFIVGALHGAQVLPARHLTLINEKNGFNLVSLAKDIDALVAKQEG